jgi:hypothetical protein
MKTSDSLILIKENSMQEQADINSSISPFQTILPSNNGNKKFLDLRNFGGCKFLWLYFFMAHIF